MSQASDLTAPKLDLNQPQVFRLSPLIRLTLLLLYIALTLPLPFLADVTEASVSPRLLAIGLVVGLGLLYVALTERVTVDEQGIRVSYPGWISWLWRRGWSLQWSEIQALKPRSTGQGGIVYYFLSRSSDTEQFPYQGKRAYLLPMRIVGFAQLVRIVEAKTGIDTRDVKPLAQPWMYLILLLLTLMLLAIDAWTITTALGQA
ncbi:hypothetical protein NDI45_21820 [Leptolyngbya sp. GB1-A1]|uniref:hypothetical protein n=1 Tax=Leptolyngbya sp. GB1-A1 TaxID=2933908 RepID=UPI0032974650